MIIFILLGNFYLNKYHFKKEKECRERCYKMNNDDMKQCNKGKPIKDWYKCVDRADLWLNTCLDKCIDEYRVTQPETKCKSLSDENIIELVKNRPEVQEFFNLDFPERNKPHIDIDHSEGNNVTVQVYETVIDYPETGIGHTATFDWYTVDKCNGNIKCMFCK